MKNKHDSAKPVALITGGSRGIGLGIATCLAEEGYDLAINGVREEDLIEGVLAELRSLGSRVIYCRGNIADSSDRSQIIAKVRAEFGRLNVLVNNAGVAPKERRDILEATEESFDYIISTNLKGPYFLTQLAASWMIEQKKDNPGFPCCIINISSVSSTLASINRGDYCIAKAGISMSTMLFAVRLGEYDIPVYEVRPGIIDTDMTAAVKGKYDKLIENGITIQKRWGYPKDVGKAVASLSRGDFSFSTGQVIMVDGGMTIGRL
jgi:NAD(P)-dependent dehydrogenase (short-subunit alcohol dehydrogenase family)